MQQILVVDDDDAIREMLTLAFEIEGYSVQNAANGELALMKLKNGPLPKLIFLDLMMPVMNGWQFLENISKDSRLSKIPVVVVSAFSEHAANLGGKAVLKKPIDLNRIFFLVKRYVDNDPPNLAQPDHTKLPTI